ncbi:MAG: magnesium transporter [Phycisphaerae bacterium]
MSNPGLSYTELHEAWPLLSGSDRVAGFSLLSRAESEELFDTLDARGQSELILELPSGERRMWMRVLAPDDAADVVQETEEDEDRRALLSLLDEPTRKEVLALLAYAEDEAGGLMNPRYARLRPDMTVDAAISYLRRQTHEELENIAYPYVLDGQQHLLGVVSLPELVSAPGDKKVCDVMDPDVIAVGEETDQEAVSNVFAEHDLVVIPVVDQAGRMKGIVTVDDIVDVVREEATEDMQKIGGTEALDAPYLQVDLLEMLKKRAGWLAALVLLGFLSVLAMRTYKEIIDQVVILALFVPLIISSGGNSGSQAATLVVRAMALDEVRLRDWWRVVRRELAVGLTLGTILGIIGLIATLLWLTYFDEDAQAYHFPVALTIACSILGVALWGTLAGSMLPFLLRSFGFDPASASAPLVATLVDASGLVIYLGIASVLLRGMLS